MHFSGRERVQCRKKFRARESLVNMEVEVKHAIAIATGLIIVALTCAGTGAGQQATHTYSTLQEKVAALRDLRDSGVLTQQEYEAKVRQLQPSSLAAAPAQPGRFAWPGTRTVQADDPHYQMTAFTLEVPATWKYAGAIEVSGAGTCHAGESNLKLTMQSPDGLYQIMKLPGVQWAASNNPQAEQNMARKGCPAVEIVSAADFMVNILLAEMHPNAKVLEVLGPGPGLQQAMQQKYQADVQYDQTMSQIVGSPLMQFKFDGARVRVQYDLDGKPMEEMLSGFVGCSEMRMPDRSTRRGCTTSDVLLVQAPLGQLDALMAMPEFDAMMKSAQPNPDWVSRRQYDNQMKQQAFVNGLVRNQQMTQQMIAASNTAFQARMQANQTFFNTLMENGRQFNNNLQASGQRAIAEDQARQNHMDAEAHQWTLYAGDRHETTNPYNGQTVTVSNRYAQQWISSDGRTVVNSNTGVNPNDYTAPGDPTFAPLIPH